MQRPVKIEDDLRKALIKSGRTHYELAQQADVDVSAVNRFIHGKRGLTVASFAQVARTVGLDLKLERRRKTN